MSEDIKQTNESKEDAQKVDKQFWLTTFALNNRNTVYFLALLIVVMGVITYQALPKDSYPEIEQPIVYVGTPYPGNSPVDIENLVTREIEKELNTISEVEEIKSTSVQDYSTIIVEFQADMAIEDALQKAKDAVDRAKPELPSDLPQDPNVFEMNFSEFPIMNINLSGNYTINELEEFAELIEDEVEKISEISKVEIRGVEEKEVKILVNPYEMEARNVTFNDLSMAVRDENITMSGGNILADGVRRSIRIVGEFTDPQQMLDIVIKHEKGNIVYLKDVAEIEFGYVEKESYARLAQKPVVSVDIIKRSGENMLRATEKIDVVMKDLESQLPDDLVISRTNDQSTFVKEMVSSLENNIISGVILVVLVLLFFLGTRNALFVGIAIPLSMFIAFNILGALGVTVNMMILFSLILALGMLVDNGIVVVENVYRLMEEGYSPLAATKKGVGEVAMPIISSTATTLAAFLPLALWPGLMGQFMSYLPMGVMITLASSLFVALVINPVLISTFMKVEGPNHQVNKTKMWRNVAIVVGLGVLILLLGGTALGNLLIVLGVIIVIDVYALAPMAKRFQAGFLPRLENLYSRVLTFALAGWKPYVFFFGTVGLLIFSFMLMSAFPPKVVFFPINEPKYVNVFIELPIGTDIETTNQFSKKIEKRVQEIIEPYEFLVESVIAKVGEDTADPNDPSAFGQSSTPNKARITVNFEEFKDRRDPETGDFVMTSDIMEEIRSGIPEYPGVAITVDKDANGPPAGKPVNIEVVGPDIAKLIELTDDMKKVINESGIEGIEKLKTDLETGKPELIVDIDREKARRFGLSTSLVAQEVRTSLFGSEISKFKMGEDDYDIEVRLQDKYRYDLDALMNKSITFRDQTTGKIHQVPISSVANAELSSTYGSVKRKDLDRIITISSNVLGGYNPTEINNQIKELLADYEMPPGYTYKFGGEQEQQAEEMAFLSQALLLAVFLIFLIIVSQFNKITTPFIIMTSVLLSTIGVFLGLVIFNMDFVVIMTMIGIISLAGIVVNNAIVLIDFIELSRERKQRESGVDKLPFEEVVQSIVDAGKTRLRPVLLTAITTILGLLPLAVGINIDFIKLFTMYDADFYMGGDNVIFWGPMSWTIIFGLTFATFLTLVIVPVMYLFFAKINRKLGIS
ncbi:efflux RND transporter permease subunit [Marinoscillum furvescens]|uniref:Multidrug efflux pump subunit AcrB n=1 Tax=Marinoscillum furvescens DSM 4134 TaxID=1122208 RepID=A0A3D9L767_MARFU|nr:efflux RND transporter permease subunit [Marinoscillum furvescens]REE02189.1 multidrug efflux pump subunit AcrB [Marinoscillum furvescens DSM 4134]